MARTATKKQLTKSLRMSESMTPKPKRGRPLGSKNRALAEPNKTTRSAARMATSRKAPPAMPKLSKAELEAQLAKLERAVSRLREQNKELKRLVREGAEAAEAAAAAPKPTRSRTRAAAVPKAPQAKPPEPVPHDDSAAGAGVDAEDHEAAA